MEEMISTEALEREILEDARKKAERALHEAEAEARKILVSAEARARRVIAELETEYAARAEHVRREAEARLPLEKSRLKTAHIDARLRACVAEFISELPADRALSLAKSLVEEGLSALSAVGEAGPSAFAELGTVRYRELPRSSVEGVLCALFPRAELPMPEEDDTLPARGFVLESANGYVRLRATLDLVAERLVDARRGELARALCAEALSL